MKDLRDLKDLTIPKGLGFSLQALSLSGGCLHPLCARHTPPCPGHAARLNPHLIRRRNDITKKEEK